MPKGIRSLVFNNKKGIVKGFFGGGKTYTTIREVARELIRNKRSILVIYAAPLRKLRDFVYNNWIPEEVKREERAKVFLAHEEACPMLRNRLQNLLYDGEPAPGFYYRILAEHLRDDDCSYPEHVRKIMELMEMDGTRLIATTHDLAVFLSMIALGKKIDYVAIFDEAEDFMERISRPFPREEIDALKQIDEKAYQRIRRLFELRNNMYWLRSNRLSHLAHNVIISATLPKLLEEFIKTFYGWTPEIRINTRCTRDRVVVYTNVIRSSDAMNPQAMNTLVKLVDKAVTEYGAVGIIAKNLDHEKQILTTLATMGYKVTAEVKDDKLDPYAEVFVLTPGGKWFRGVSIFSRRLKRDIPVTIAFYQGGRPSTINPVLHNILSLLIDNIQYGDIDAFLAYSNEMNWARNLQALYRFNRRRDLDHTMILLDKRWVTAYRHYHLRKWMEMKKTHTMDLKEVSFLL